MLKKPFPLLSLLVLAAITNGVMGRRNLTDTEVPLDDGVEMDGADNIDMSPPPNPPPPTDNQPPPPPPPPPSAPAADVEPADLEINADDETPSVNPTSRPSTSPSETPTVNPTSRPSTSPSEKEEFDVTLKVPMDISHDDKETLCDAVAGQVDDSVWTSCELKSIMDFEFRNLTSEAQPVQLQELEVVLEVPDANAAIQAIQDDEETFFNAVIEAAELDQSISDYIQFVSVEESEETVSDESNNEAFPQEQLEKFLDWLQNNSGPWSESNATAAFSVSAIVMIPAIIPLLL